MLVESPYRGLDCAGQIIIIRIQPGHDLTLRTRHPFVDRLGLTGLLFRGPICQARRVFLDDLRTATRGSAVDDDIFDARISLIEYGSQGLFEIGSLIEGGGDDGDEGHIYGTRMNSEDADLLILV